MISKDSTKRNRKRTEARILTAVGQIVDQYGFNKIGVNLIAKTAGVNKVLIYRYFESVQLLKLEFIKSDPDVLTAKRQYIDRIEELLTNNNFSEFMLAMLRDFRGNKRLHDLLLWEIQSGQHLTPDADRQVSKKILEKLDQMNGYEDAGALFALLSAGIYCMVVFSEYHGRTDYLNLSSEQGWKRIETIIERISALTNLNNIDNPF